MFFYADQFLWHRHSYTIQNQRSNLSQKKDSWKNVHDSNESLWFFCLDRLLRIEYAFSHYISPFFPHGQSAGFVLIWSFLIWNTFLSIYFFTVIINIFSVAHVPHHFSLFFSFLDNTNIEDTVSDQVAASSSTADLHQGGCRRGEKGHQHIFFYVYIYVYIYTCTLGNTSECSKVLLSCFLSFNHIYFLVHFFDSHNQRGFLKPLHRRSTTGIIKCSHRPHLLTTKVTHFHTLSHHGRVGPYPSSVSLQENLHTLTESRNSLEFFSQC